MRSADRVAWLEDVHIAVTNVQIVRILDDAPIDYESPPARATHSAVVDAALRHGGGDRIDAVFPSEKYGHDLAAYYRAVHIDPTGTGSSTRVRNGVSATLAAQRSRSWLTARNFGNNHASNWYYQYVT